MSVPLYRRRLSRTEYIWRVRQLTIRVGEIIANKPKKYKGIYSDKIVYLSLNALSEVVFANEIYIETSFDYENRRSHLLNARGDLWALLTISDIFLEQIKKSPIAKDLQEKRDSKIVKQQFELGREVRECVALINGVMESDKKRYRNL